MQETPKKELESPWKATEKTSETPLGIPKLPKEEAAGEIRKPVTFHLNAGVAAPSQPSAVRAASAQRPSGEMQGVLLSTQILKPFKAPERQTVPEPAAVGDIEWEKWFVKFEAEVENANPPIPRDSWIDQLRIQLSCEAKVKLRDALDYWRSQDNFDQADGYELVIYKMMHAAGQRYHAGTYLVRLTGIESGKRSAPSLLKYMAQLSSLYERARPRAGHFDRLKVPVIPQGTLVWPFLQRPPESADHRSPGKEARSPR